MALFVSDGAVATPRCLETTAHRASDEITRAITGAAPVNATSPPWRLPAPVTASTATDAMTLGKPV